MRRAALAVLAASLPVLAPSAAHAFHVTEIDRWSSPLDLPPDLLGAGLTLAASPDGANVYAASAAAGTILVFERGPVSGTLALNEIEQDGVGSADGIEGVRDVIVSRDGANVYAAGYGEDAVAVFARDAGSGALALVEVERDGVGGVAGLVAPRDIALSPGGEHLYAVGSAAIAVFARGADGRLAFVEFQSEAADAIDGLTDAEVVLVSADGRHVYVGARGEGGKIAIFSRNETSGALTWLGIFANGDQGSDFLDALLQLVGTADGRFLYGSGGSRIHTFARDAATGLLTYQGPALLGTGTRSIALSRDDSRIVAAGASLGAFLVAFSQSFARDPATGALTPVPGGAFGGAYSESGTGDELVWIGDVLYAAGQPTSQDTSPTIAALAISPFDYREHEADGAGGADALAGAAAAAVAPDGAHVYVAATDEDAIQVLARDAAGDLAPAGAHRDGVGGVDGLNGAAAVTVSPDGEHVYTAATVDDAVAAFARDPTTGALTFVELEKDGVGGVTSLNGANAVVTSPNGAHVYVLAPFDSAIASFARSPLSGALTLVDEDAGLAQLGQATGLAMSPDGAHLYTAAPYVGSVGVFARSAATGSLTARPAADLAAVGIAGLEAVVVAPDGRHVYATESFGERVVALARDADTGALTPLDVYESDGMDPADVAMTRDGAFVVVPGVHQYDLLHVLRRDRTSGRLALHTTGLSHFGLTGLQSLALAPDGRTLYATSDADDSVAVFVPEPGGAALALAAAATLACRLRGRRRAGHAARIDPQRR